MASTGTRSLSCRLMPQAPTSPSRPATSTGERGGRTKSPKGSRPRWPTVHSPKENLCSGFTRNGAALIDFSLGRAEESFGSGNAAISVHQQGERAAGSHIDAEKERDGSLPSSKVE